MPAPVESSMTALDGAAAGPTLAERWTLWLTRASITGLAVSLCLHVVFLVVAAFAVVGGGGGGSGSGPSGAIELGIVTHTELAAMADSPMTAMTPGVEEPTDMAAPSLPGVEMPGGEALPDAGGLGSMGSGLGGSGTGEGIGIGEGAGGAGGGGGTSFFGVEARGSRFAYIVDVSGSMRGEKLEMLKRELKESINAMPENGQFCVILFESEAIPLQRRERWTDATAKNKKEACASIDLIEARGGTNPVPGFIIAFGLRPRADAVYFMTDGLFEDASAERIVAMNRGGQRTPVHCLTLLDRAAEALMKHISKESGGTYHHIEYTR